MNYYVVKGKNDKIYAGDVTKVVDENKNTEYAVNIGKYYIYDFQRSLWEEWPNPDNHIGEYLSKKRYVGQLKSYPSLELAKKRCEEALR